MPPTSSPERATVDVFCTRCNILVEADVRVTTSVSGVGDLLEGISYEQIGTTYFEIAICRRCTGPFLLQRRVGFVEGNHETLMDEVVLFPSARPLSIEGVPSTIARIHDQAVRSFKAGLAEPCAIMCRKAIEAVCAELGAGGRNLHDKLADLRQSGRLDAQMVSWADNLRIIGNDAAHDLSMTLDQNDARDALEFVEAILLYVLSLRAKFEAFQ